MCMRYSFILGIALAAILSVSGVADAQTLTSPDAVKRALTVLNRVKDHTGRLVAARNYAQLSHENEEFKEGAEARGPQVRYTFDPGPLSDIVRWAEEVGDTWDRRLGRLSKSLQR